MKIFWFQYQNILRQTNCTDCAVDTGHYDPTQHHLPFPNKERVGEKDNTRCLTCPVGKQSNKNHNGCSDCTTGTRHDAVEDSFGCSEIKMVNFTATITKIGITEN